MLDGSGLLRLIRLEGRAQNQVHGHHRTGSGVAELEYSTHCVSTAKSDMLPRRFDIRTTNWSPVLVYRDLDAIRRAARL